MNLRILLLVALLAPLNASALEIFACEPEWGALAKELAGPEANITSATTPFQDPHRVQAKPSLIAAVRRAELLVCSGAQLEIGWLPLLLRRAGNAAIQAGQPGYLLGADYVRKLERPSRIDRAAGDIHPEGNPHIQLNPHNIERVASELGKRLAQVDPGHAADYQARLDDFLGRWDKAMADWETRAAPLAGMRLVSHHRSFSYLADWLQLDIVAELEPKPGVPPTSSHLAELLEQLSAVPPQGIIRTPYTDPKPSQWLAGQLGVPAVVLPYTIGGADTATDLFGLFDTSIAVLLELRQ